MPIRGAKVRRSKWFNEITQSLQDRGFKRGAPDRIACPGFYFYSRDGYVIQILPKSRDALVRYIELPRTA